MSAILCIIYRIEHYLLCRTRVAIAGISAYYKLILLKPSLDLAVRAYDMNGSSRYRAASYKVKCTYRTVFEINDGILSVNDIAARLIGALAVNIGL